MGKSELFWPPLKQFITACGAFPVRRGERDLEAIRVATELCRAGHIVVMFPEGERTHDGLLEPFKPGFSLLVKKAKSPIIPAGIAGAYAAFPRTKKLPRLAPLFMPPSDATIAVETVDHHPGVCPGVFDYTRRS